MNLKVNSEELQFIKFALLNQKQELIKHMSEDKMDSIVKIDILLTRIKILEQQKGE